MTIRGGPQVIPRPSAHRPGEPAPWASLHPARRTVALDALRQAFTGRVGVPSVVEQDPGARGSAVLAAFWEHHGEVEVLLTRRSGELRSHRGEVAFPGGRRDPGETMVATALREAREEVGLDPAKVEVLGELDHLMTISSGAFIVPVVALLPGRPTDLVPSPSEVDAVLFVPVAELLLDEVYREERWSWQAAVDAERIRSTGDGVPPGRRIEEATGGVGQGDVDLERPIFFFELVGDTLWGATAAMVRQLLGMALALGTDIDHA